MEDIITKAYVLKKLREIMDDEEVKTKDKLSALKMAGDYLKMFGTKIDIDIRALIAQLSNAELKGLKNAERIKGSIEGDSRQEASLPGDTVIIDCQPVD